MTTNSANTVCPKNIHDKIQRPEIRLRRWSFLAKDEDLYEIRYFTEDDRDQIIRNVNQVVSDGSFLAVARFVLTRDWQTCFSNSMSSIENRHFLVVATNHGKVVGHCRLFPTDTSTSKRTSGEMGFLVLREYSNVGVGSALVSNVIDCARNAGYKRIFLYTASENKPALHLAEKFGFEEESRLIGYYFFQNKYMDEILMSRLLI